MSAAISRSRFVASMVILVLGCAVAVLPEPGYGGEPGLAEIFRRLPIFGNPVTLSEEEREIADGWPITASLLYRETRSYLVLHRSEPATGRTAVVFYWVSPDDGWDEEFTFRLLEASDAYWATVPVDPARAARQHAATSQKVATATRGILIRGNVRDGLKHPWLVLAWTSGKSSEVIETAHPMIALERIADREGFAAELGIPIVGADLDGMERRK